MFTLFKVYFGNVGFHVCGVLSYVALVLGIFTLIINEAALAMRVWYLFTRKRFLQHAVVVLTLACMILTVALVASIPDTRPQDVPSACDFANNPRTEWRMFLPPVALHVMLYGLTLYQLLSISGEIRELTSMLIDEGAHLYLLSTMALVYGLIGTTMPDNANAFFPATYSALVQVVMSVAVSRAMLILRNLAARLHVDPGWLLSYSELSRINYRQGLHDGELLVEIQTGAGSMLEMGDLHPLPGRIPSVCCVKNLFARPILPITTLMIHPTISLERNPAEN
ncbi:hypothetical protein DEU56DRAFT_980724 [Suillus clintonianus]|uniref:uncharacterized protein n=1 Tax=Suillus clintonianus TaxID=1904413 RepID=UPI001B86BC1B|nr:uncharacterized protein DEU56DRAFT_980724 [Suillus clintonianus]KAG2137525.1 hypothetical protein DEU56DRAFT_980724 [Suillus clintonianus]